MKKDIHPAYFNKAQVKCSCGNEFEVGSVLEKIDVEICGACHPFYSGEEKIIDTGGRVERFKRRKEAANPVKPVKASKPIKPAKKAEKKDKADKKDKQEKTKK